MKIQRVEAWPVAMRLAEPYTIAYETIDSTVNVFLKIETDTGLCGFGCAAPDLEVTGETEATVMQVMDDVVKPQIIGADPLRFASLIGRLRPSMERHPSALAAMDMALFDLLGKACGAPVWKMLGGFRDCIPTSITIGILPLPETVSKAGEFVARGFTSLKIKGGIDVDRDIERVLRVREVVGRQVGLRFDANQGFSVEQAVLFATATQSTGLEFIEQPTARENPALLGQVTEASPVPIMADESLMTVRDALDLACRRRAAMINIKLMKVGGISEAQHVDSVARAAGMTSMVGCMDESALAIAAGLHFALARPNVVCADLDGHFDLVDDPAAGAVILKDGTLYPHDAPGLGFSLR
ncbi:MAG: mandelate racemase/muconate lactonizing enzyme family protein [Candidatus Zhuqueibacterota bacterium]